MTTTDKFRGKKEAPGKDLLSAALDESGLDMEFNDFVSSLQGQKFMGSANERLLQGLSMLQSQHMSPSSLSSGPSGSNQGQMSNFFGLGSLLGSGQNSPYDSKSSAASAAAAMSVLANGEGWVMGGGRYPAQNGGYPYGQMGGAMQAALSNAELATLWQSDDRKRRTNAYTVDAMKTESPEEGDDEEEEDELGHAETYADYMPSKLKIGEKHPDPVVETSSLSSVPPPDVWYSLSIPESAIDYCYLSALQLEAIVYASQQHEQLLPDGSRAGYLVGDGAGVGKGRTIAGIIYENYLLGRKRSLWVSVSNDLRYDAQRDLKDIGAGKIDLHALNKLKYAKISSKVNGSVKKGVIFATYSSLIGESQSGGKYKTRLKQLIHWCGEDFDGVVVFDECHKAKNLCPVGSAKPTKTGLTVLELQKQLPKARVVYASATGASEPKNMAYMTRLGLWGPGTPFREFTEFIQAVERRGVGAMEIVAMDMKLRGTYIARQLSFSGVTFKIDEIPLSDEFIRIYDESVRLWVEAREKFQQSVVLIDGEQRMKKTMWGQFWSSHQRFFKYMCIASKVDYAVRLAREAVKDGKCVVIGLQSTGEARTLEQLEEAGGELNDFVSTAKGVFQTLVEKHFPAPDRKRIHRLLGIQPAPVEIKQESPGGSPSTSSGIKRKSERKARQNKRYKEEKLSGESGADSDSDFILSASSESEDSNFESPEPSDSDDHDSDFNPFGDGSDSDDADPWLSRKSKKKSKAASRKNKKNNMWSKKLQKNKYNGDHGGSDGNDAPPPPPKDAIERACAMKDELLAKLESIGSRLPPNTLDQLIDDLGGPDNVAEMTGRKGRVVSTDDGGVQYESRCETDVPLETLNLTEKQRFMDGVKHIAIISEAASSGISLQSDRRAKNQRRRVHITLELPWSADRAIQQFGRTHRSNQVNAPEYLFLISDLAGERRFASIVAKRLESLGALTHGDRRATESRDLSQFNIDNKYGRASLETVMKSVMGMEMPIVPPPSDYDGDFFQDVQIALIGVGLVAQDERCPSLLTLDKDYNNMSKFLNRILGIEVELQNRLFKYFSDTLSAIISQAKKAGRFDMGILDLGTSGDQVKRFKCETYLMKHATGTAKIDLHTVSVERGMTWSQASDIWTELTGKDEGFYVSHIARNGKYTAVLAVSNATASRKKDKKEKSEKLYSIYRPNTGLQMRLEPLAELRRKYKKVLPDEAQPHWQEQYDSASLTCSHVYWRGSCRRVILGLPCDMGLRRKMYHILSGSVLTVWTKMESVISSTPGGHNAKLQVIRVKTEDGLRIVGSVIPLNCYATLVNLLAQDCTKTYTEAF